MFGYGCHNIKEMAERIGAPVVDLGKRAYAAHAKGWVRGFTGISKRMGNTSVATMLHTGNETDQIEGIVVKLTAAEVATLDAYEKFPDWYDRKAVKLTAYRDADDNQSSETSEIDG